MSNFKVQIQPALYFKEFIFLNLHLASKMSQLCSMVPLQAE